MVKVLFDHNMPPSIACALNEIVKLEGHEAVALKDKFSIDIADTDYFEILGREKDWVIISKDLQNGKKKAERAGIGKNKILAIYLSKSVQKQRINEQAATILWQWDKIVAQKALNESGLFVLPQNKGSKFSPLK